MTTFSPRGTGLQEYDAELRLVDHQIVGEDGELLGNVDDLALVQDGRSLLVSSLLVGPEALGGRLPGRLGTWTLAIWRRLRPDLDPGPIQVPLGDVLDVDSALRVRHARAEQLAGQFGLEQWLLHYVISRIPGARNDPDAEGYPDRDMRPGAHDELATVSRRVSELLGAEVVTSSGSRVGRVLDVRLRTRHGHISSGLEVVGLLVSPRQVAGTLGYLHDERMRPRPLGALVRRWHRASRWLRFEEVTDVDWVAHRLRVSG